MEIVFDRQTHTHANLRRLFKFTVKFNYYCITMTIFFFLNILAAGINKNQDNSTVCCGNSSLIPVRS